MNKTFVFKCSVIGYNEFIEIKEENLEAAVTSFKKLYQDLTDVEDIFQKIDCKELEEMKHER